MRPISVVKFFCLLMLAGLLAACDSPSSASPVPPAATPVQMTLSRGVVASARVVPDQVSELGFPLSGRLREILVRPGEQVQAGQMLAVLEAPALEGAVAQAEAVVRAAQIEYDYYLLPRRQPPVFLKKPWKGPTAGPLEPPERRQLAETRLTAAQAGLDVARASAAQAALKAPFDGVVTNVAAAPGEAVNASQPVVVLASLDRLQIETTDLGERDVARIRRGQAAQVYVEALDMSFPARVVRVVPRAERIGGDVIFRLILALESQPPGLRWGMSAEVTFTE